MPTIQNPLPGFTDWFNGIGANYLTKPSELQNNLTRHNYMGRFFHAGRDMSKMLKGGQSLRHAVNLTLDGNVGYYTPGQVRNFNNEQGIEYATSGWTFEEGFLSYLDAEMDLQGIEGAFDAGTLLQKFTDFLMYKEQNMFTEYNEHRERTYWATPNAALMEQTQALPMDRPREAMPINAFVNVFTAADHNVAADGLPPGFNTLLGLDPRDYVNPELNIDLETGLAKSPWDNQRIYYSQAGVAGAAQNLGRAMSRCGRASMFERMPMRPDLGQGSNLNSMEFAQYGILTSNLGIESYERTLEAGNERFRSDGYQDLHFSGLKFDGKPITWVEELDTAEIYPENNTATGLPAGEVPRLVREGQTSSRAPHYYFLNFKQGLLEFYHQKHMFQAETPYFLPDQPDVHVRRHSIWRNLHCESRRVLGVVAPSPQGADIE